MSALARGHRITKMVPKDSGPLEHSETQDGENPMALVPNLTAKPDTYGEAKDKLSAVSMDIQLLGTAPPGGSANRNWVVDYQNQLEGTEYSPVPIGFVVGVILKAPV